MEEEEREPSLKEILSETGLLYTADSFKII